MPTNVVGLRIDSAKSQTSELKTGFFIFLLCTIGLVASLVLLSSLTGALDASDVAQLVGP